MLDKIKDIVPEVDETKANLIYQKARKPKFSFNLNFNFKWVLRIAAIIVLLVPVIVIAGISGNTKAEAPNYEPTLEAPEADSEMAPGMNGVADESILFNGEFVNGVLTLTFGDSYKVFYIKVYEGYSIKSLKENNEQVSAIDSVYKVNALSTIEIHFNDNDLGIVKVLISIDGVNYKCYSFNN